MRRTYKARKLLVASIGVASVTYAACGGQTNVASTNPTDAGSADGPQVIVGNLMDSGNPDVTAGNLMPPDAQGYDVAVDVAAPTDAGVDVIQDAANDTNDEAG